MSKHWRFFKFRRGQFIQNVCKRHFSNTGDKTNIENIRNIGILAHIDAGKTTTTERMLYYSGTIRSMGEVHHGNTVTDYMEQERQRGITITSAAVSFPWRDHQINLIDTPGHIDFTMEVEQCLSVLDGAVIVLDSSAGVEAQTLTVWRQTESYRVPRLLYLNKMDRGDADLTMCLRSIQDKLEAVTLPLHMDSRSDGKLMGVIDNINLQHISWGGRGIQYTKRKLTEKIDCEIWERAMTYRREIVDTLSSVDDTIADIVIGQDSLDDIDSKDIAEAVRRVTLAQLAFPVLCGSSYKHIGVQTLMDAVVNYLPSPLHCNKLYGCFEKELCARAFKVQHDDQKGVLTYFRVFNGEISKGQKFYSLGQDKSEQSGPLYVAYADDYKNVSSVATGNIAVVSGLKATMSGDLVTTSAAAANRAKASLLKTISTPGFDTDDLMLPSVRQRLSALETEPDRHKMVDILLGVGTRIPPPVFLCTVEPPSQAYQTAMDAALAELRREDPSLRVTYDEETGQTVLAGMGELHLEIIKERIIREYRVDIELGPLQIAYRETLSGQAKLPHVLERKIANNKQSVKVTLSARHVKDLPEDKILKFDKSTESASNLSHVHPRVMSAVKQGVQSALSHGPKLSCPMVDVEVTLHWLEVGGGTADTAVASAVAHCLKRVFEESGSVLLEPLMSVEVVCPDTHTSRVMADLTRRRTDICDVTARGNSKVITCLAPLSELLGYSSTLRSLSSGGATFTMEFYTNRPMTAAEERDAIKRVTGF